MTEVAIAKDQRWINKRSKRIAKVVAPPHQPWSLGGHRWPVVTYRYEKPVSDRRKPTAYHAPHVQTTTVTEAAFRKAFTLKGAR